MLLLSSFDRPLQAQPSRNAYRFGVGDKVLGYNSSVSLALEELLQKDDVDGLGLLNRIALLSMGKGVATKARHTFVAKTVQRMKPLNPTVDGKALRVLAFQVQG